MKIKLKKYVIKATAVVIVLSFSAILDAQTIIRQNSKMSGYLNQLSREYSRKSAKRAPMMEASAADSVWTLLKLTSEEENIQKVAQQHGCRVVDRIGNIHIVVIPVPRLEQVASDSRVLRVEAHQLPKPNMNKVPELLDAPRAWEGHSPLSQAFTGKGVICGVVDNGLDFTHRMFYDSLGNCRISRYFDLMPDTDEQIPDRTYNPTELLVLQHSSDAKKNYHGTHVAGIMAGSYVTGAKDNYSGIANESELVMAGVTNTWVSGATSATLITAIKHIFDYAEEAGKPCVINISLGYYVQFGESMELEDEAIESMMGPGRIIVAGVGNEGWNANWFTSDFWPYKYTTAYKPADVDSINLNCYSAQYTDLYAQHKIATSSPQTFILTNSEDRGFQIKIETSFLDSIARQFGDEQFAVKYQDTVYYENGSKSVTSVVTTKGRKKPSNKYSSEYYLSINFCEWKSEDSENKLFLGYEWDHEAALVGETACELYTNPQFSMLLYNKRDNYTYTKEHSVLWPSSIDNVIGVGALNTYPEKSHTYQDYGEIGKIASFSSQGPSWNNEIKPEVVAPGVEIISAYNVFSGVYSWSSFPDTITTDNGLSYMKTNTGTSMACPVVAGAIALWLQAKPDLTAQEIKQICARTCTKPEESLEYPNNVYGYGLINVYAGLLDILGLSNSIDGLTMSQPDNVRILLNGRTLSVVDNTTGQPIDTPVTLTVYSTGGKIMATAKATTLNLSSLPNGIYAVQVKSERKETTGSTLIRL